MQILGAEAVQKTWDVLLLPIQKTVTHIATKILRAGVKVANTFSSYASITRLAVVTRLDAAIAMPCI